MSRDLGGGPGATGPLLGGLSGSCGGVRGLARSCELAGGSLGRTKASPRTNTTSFIRQVLRRACSEELPCEMCRAAGLAVRLNGEAASASTSSAPSPRLAMPSPATSSTASPRLPRGGLHSMTSAREGELLQQVKASVPRLSCSMMKGECGRVAVFGGCVMHTGAAYFAAIAALRCGADVVHVFCEREAGPVVRGYSPELAVHPVLDQEYGMEEIEHWLPRLHAVVLGPGLGRNQSMGGRLALILEKIKALDLPVVVDADGLWHLATNPSMLRGYSKAVITPNPQEFSRLARGILNLEVPPSLLPDPHTVSQLARALGHLTVLHKGTEDVISDGRTVELGLSAGSPRRCGGQGDLLTGLLAAFLAWGHRGEPGPAPCLVAAWAASRLARACAAQAFAVAGRGMLAQDVLDAIRPEFARLYESETFL